ncbi:hypothetical protein BDV93DRAFT_222167 [Ceratobasidium sp. AG-I]|nr:hypothetical protein BDV93DRAFT_222167 [Ceratobasidium sp. AG-I]
MGSGYRRGGRSDRSNRDEGIDPRENARSSKRRGEWSSESEGGRGEPRWGRDKGKGRMRGERRDEPRDDDGRSGKGQRSRRDDGRDGRSEYESARNLRRRSGSNGYDEGRGRRDGRNYDDYSNDEDYRDDTRRASHQRSSGKNGDGNQIKSDSRQPAGWGNFFEASRPDRSHNRSPSLDQAVSRESGVVSKGADRFRSTSRRRRSPSLHSHGSPVVDSELIPPEQASLVSASLDQTTTTHSTILARSLAPLDITSDPSSSTAAGTASKPDAPVSSAARTRAPRLAPIDAIRMHLQGHARRIGAVPTQTKDMEEENPGEARAVDQDVASSKKQHTNDASMSTTETMAPASNFSPARDGEMPVLPQDTLSSGGVSPNVNPTTSDDQTDGTQSVSYSIRGAATRLTIQPSSFTASPIGSTQRASPGSTHSPTPVRDRLLERLEAAKAATAIGNPHPIASHPPQKASHTPNEPDSSEPPVSVPSSASAAAEERLRLAVRSRSATNWPTGAGSHQEKPTGPADVALEAAEAERKSRLRARLAARKRDMGAVMGAASSGDAPTR